MERVHVPHIDHKKQDISAKKIKEEDIQIITILLKKVPLYVSLQVVL
jgi:hypothetical protein